MLVVKAWRHYYTCIVDIIALLLNRMLGWTHWSVFQRGIMSRHHFKDTELRMGHHKVIWSSLITVSRVSMDLLHQWTVIMVEWVCIRKSLYLTQEDLAGEVRQGIQMNKMWKTYYVFQGSQIRQIWRILRQNCSDDSTEVTEGVTSTQFCPYLFHNKYNLC